MPDKSSTFLEELVSAGRGVVALIIGDRKAPLHFDFSQRGLVDSFIGLLAITFVSSALPLVVPALGGEHYSIARSALATVVLFAFQLGSASIVLRQVKRMDGLVPFIVADNWASVYISVGQLLLLLFGIDGQLAFFALSILAIVVEINIARLIVTLPGLQIAMFMIAQLVGVSLALIVVGTAFPSAETQAAISSLQP